jgi:hypothetical protein
MLMGGALLCCEGYVPSHLDLACTVAELHYLGKSTLLPCPLIWAGGMTTAKAKKYDKGEEREYGLVFGLNPR